MRTEAVEVSFAAAYRRPLSVILTRKWLWCALLRFVTPYFTRRGRESNPCARTRGIRGCRSTPFKSFCRGWWVWPSRWYVAAVRFVGALKRLTALLFVRQTPVASIGLDVILDYGKASLSSYEGLEWGSAAAAVLYLIGHLHTQTRGCVNPRLEEKVLLITALCCGPLTLISGFVYVDDYVFANGKRVRAFRVL